MYSQITLLSKITASPPSGRGTRSSGTLLRGEISRNQSGLLPRSIITRSKGTPFSISVIAARWA